MSHEEHEHDEDDIHSDSHGHEHDEHQSHHDNYHEEYDEHDLNEDDVYDEEEEDDEIEEKEFIKINDILKVEEIEDVDLSSFFVYPELQVYKKLFKQNTSDLKNKLKDINLSFKPIIKILKITKSFDNIAKTKKIKTIYVNDYYPETDQNSINLLDIENFHSEKGPYSDIIKPKKTINKILISKLKNTSNNIKKINLLKLGSIFSLIILLLASYGFYTKYKLENTFSKIEKLSFSSDIKKINSDLISIKTDLIISNFLLKPITLFNLIIQNKDISNLNYILLGIKDLVDFGLDGLVIYDGVNNLISKKGFEEVMYSQLINNVEPIILDMDNKINSSQENLGRIKNLGNDKLNDTFFKKLDDIKILKNYFNVFNQNKDIFKTILGDEKKKTYLIVFQNNDEIRPTGGFMGSVGFLEIFKGKILNFEKKDIYALEWDLKPFAEKAPEGINKISDNFGLRDANYYPSIKESSEKIKYFLDKTNYKIDGIVYINQNLILNALNEFGGLYFDQVKREINAENFSMLMSTLVEAKVARTHTLATPKQVLFDFSEEFFKKLKKDGNYLGYLKLFFDSIEKKDIIFYSFLEEENKVLKDFGLYKENNLDNYFDFNFPVFTSISGNKSDRYVKRTFTKNIKVNEDCSINTALNIIQKHNFNITEEINIKNFLYDMDLLGKVDINSTLEIQGKGINRQYIRVLIPKNSKIEENEKTKVKDFENYKEVSFYLNTNTLFESNFEIKYKLENPECRSYNYEFIKQPGINNYQLNINKDGNLVDSVYTAKDYIFNN